MKKNDWMLLLSVCLYSYLFYNQSSGINFLIFTIFLLAALVVQDKNLIRKRSWQLAATGSILSALCIAYYGNTLSVAANIISLSLVSCLSAVGQSSVIFALLFSFYSYVSALIFMCIDRIERKRTAAAASPGTSVKKITLVIIPVLITLVFFFMYRASNVLFNDLAKNINLDFISWPWIAFTLGGFVLLYGFFYHRKISTIQRFDENAPNNILSSETNTAILFGKKLSISEEDFSGRTLFVMLNILLLIVNGLDINFLFIEGKLPKGLSYSEFVHQGTGMLITSIVVAIAVILFYFRGPLNFYKKSNVIKFLAYLWIIQNVFMLFSTVTRNEMYINEYGLTHKRIGVYVYLLLAAIGLITTLYKIAKAKSNMYLFRANSWLFYSALVIACFFNWDLMISHFNIQKAGQLDKEYLVKLSNTNLPLLYAFKQDTLHKHKEFSSETDERLLSEYERTYRAQYNFDQELNTKLFFFLHNMEEYGWRSWHYDARVITWQLNKMKVYNSIHELTLGATRLTSVTGLQHFTALKKLNLFNNYIHSLEGIETLYQLEDLEISRNFIADLSPLYKLKNLKCLRIAEIDAAQLKTLKIHLPNTLINP